MARGGFWGERDSHVQVALGNSHVVAVPPRTTGQLLSMADGSQAGSINQRPFQNVGLVLPLCMVGTRTK